MKTSSPWLNRLKPRRQPLERWTDALERHRGDSKVIGDIS
jgi:hypothetical protein